MYYLLIFLVSPDNEMSPTDSWLGLMAWTKLDKQLVVLFEGHGPFRRVRLIYSEEASRSGPLKVVSTTAFLAYTHTSLHDGFAFRLFLL